MLFYGTDLFFEKETSEMTNAGVKIRESLCSSVRSAYLWNTDGADDHGKTRISLAFSCRRQDSKFEIIHVGAKNYLQSLQNPQLSAKRHR